MTRSHPISKHRLGAKARHGTKRTQAPAPAGAHPWRTATTTCCQQIGRLSVHVAYPALTVCGWLLGRVGHAALTVTTFLAASTACAFMPPIATCCMGVASLASPRLAALRPLQPLRKHVLPLAGLRVLMPPLMPGVWRAVQYWQRSLPIIAGYLRTANRARTLRRQGQGKHADQLWAAQHQAGADQIFDVLANVKGFYLKLAQILATKTDMLPSTYTSSLSRLMDCLPPAPWPQVRRTLERELKRTLEAVFESVDEFPLASATVAQVHAAQLAQPGNPHVAVKVQHRGVRRTMHADLANMRLFVELCDMAHVDLGFDLGSVVREYQVAVPMEFMFDKEAEAMMSVRESLIRRAQDDLPALRHVIIPCVYRDLCSSRVVVMERLEGVPLLHAAAMDVTIKHGLMHALVMAYGVQILSDGFFHTDPHGGNLMACTDDFGDVAVGLLDFGQVKRLTDGERLRYARLVLALASRDGSRIQTTCRELGIRIEKCEKAFEEIAAYILFDTRMDIPEALQSPGDPAANAGWRTARVPKLPRDLFMIMRVVTLLRGVLASMGVHGVSSALLWRPLAEKVISDLSPPPLPELPTPLDKRTARLLLSSYPLASFDHVLCESDPETDRLEVARSGPRVLKEQQSKVGVGDDHDAAGDEWSKRSSASELCRGEASLAGYSKEGSLAGHSKEGCGKEAAADEVWREDLSLSPYTVAAVGGARGEGGESPPRVEGRSGSERELYGGRVSRVSNVVADGRDLEGGVVAGAVVRQQGFQGLGQKHVQPLRPTHPQGQEDWQQPPQQGQARRQQAQQQTQQKQSQQQQALRQQQVQQDADWLSRPLPPDMLADGVIWDDNEQ